MVVVWLAAVAGLVVGIANERLLFTPILAVGYGLVGVFLGVRRVGLRIAWVLLATASSATPGLFMNVAPEIQNGAIFAGLAILLVIFPDGSPPGRVWRIPIALAVVGMFASLLGVVSFGDFGLPMGVLIASIGIVWCAAAPIVRFRRATGTERAQMRWLGTVVALGASGVVLAGLALATGFEPLMGLAGLAVIVGFGFGIPIAIVVAVTRHRLYDLDRIVSRTVTYAVVAAAVAGTFGLIVLGATSVARGSGPVATALATLAARAVVTPVHRRVRRVVDHRFNRSAYDAAREVEDLGAWLQTTSDGPLAMGRLGEVVGRIYQPEGVTVWTPGPGSRAPNPV